MKMGSHRWARRCDLLGAPGNPGVARLSKCVPADLTKPDELLSDRRSRAGRPHRGRPRGASQRRHRRRVWRRVTAHRGPTRAAAALESSKAFAKHFMARHGVPTARFADCTTSKEALDAIARGDLGFPIVVKADGLAAGKGVVIADDRATAEAAVREAMVDRRFGGAGDRVVLEEFLVGQEASYFGPSDGRSSSGCRRRRITSGSSTAIEAEHRRHGRIRAKPARHARGRGARNQRGGRARARRDACRRPPIQGVPVRRADADGGRAESGGVQRAVRRSRGAGDPADARRGPARAADGRGHRRAAVRAARMRDERWSAWCWRPPAIRSRPNRGASSKGWRGRRRCRARWCFTPGRRRATARSSRRAAACSQWSAAGPPTRRDRRGLPRRQRIRFEGM